MLTADVPNNTPDKLLKQAQQVVEAEVKMASESTKTLPPLLISIANRAIQEVAPGEEPEQAAVRLATEWDNRHIKAAYTAILWYYENSLKSSPSPYSSYDDLMTRLSMVDVTEDLLKMLKKGKCLA